MKKEGFRLVSWVVGIASAVVMGFLVSLGDSVGTGLHYAYALSDLEGEIHTNKDLNKVAAKERFEKLFLSNRLMVREYARLYSLVLDKNYSSAEELLSGAKFTSIAARKIRVQAQKIIDLEKRQESLNKKQETLQKELARIERRISYLARDLKHMLFPPEPGSQPPLPPENLTEQIISPWEAEAGVYQRGPLAGLPVITGVPDQLDTDQDLVDHLRSFSSGKNRATFTKEQVEELKFQMTGLNERRLSLEERLSELPEPLESNEKLQTKTHELLLSQVRVNFRNLARPEIDQRSADVYEMAREWNDSWPSLSSR